MSIKFVVNGQKLYPYKSEVVVADNSIEFVEVEFQFNSEWEGMQKTAQFIQDDKRYNKILVNDRCTLPSEIKSGNFYVTVFGYKGEQRGTTVQCGQTMLNSGFGDGETPIPPTPDLYAQLLEQIQLTEEQTFGYRNEAMQYAQLALQAEEQVKETSKEVEDYALSAKKSADDAIAANTSAQQAKSLAQIAQQSAEIAVSEAQKAQISASLSADKAAIAEQNSIDVYNQAIKQAQAAQSSANIAQEEANRAESEANRAKQEANEASAILNDSIVSVEKGWSSKKIIDTLCPSFNVTGNPIICTPVEDYPLDVTATMEPIQSGTGDPSLDNVRSISGRESIKVTRCGKNLWNYSLNSGRTMWIIPFIPQGTYTISALSTADWWTGNPNNVNWFLRSADGTVWLTTVSFQNAVVGQRCHAILTIPYSGSFLLATYSTNIPASMQDLQIEPGNVATDYEPYQGDDYTLTLPKTIYGGTVDIVTGIGIEEWGYIASYNGEALSGEWISDRDVYSPDVMPTIGAEVAYKLSASQPFQASGGQSILALTGTNTVYTNGDNLTVSGRADPIKLLSTIKE